VIILIIKRTKLVIKRERKSIMLLEVEQLIFVIDISTNVFTVCRDR